MAKLLYFRGEGQKMMSGVKEYIVLVDNDVPREECEGHGASGFTLVAEYEVYINLPDDTLSDEWPVELPTEEALGKC